MSLVAAYVQSQSGRWYENPTIKGHGWFICWDDEEPIELVIARDAMFGIKDVIQYLKENHWDVRVISPHHTSRGVSRMFNGKFKPASIWFLKQLSRGPTDEMLQDAFTESFPSMPRCQGVFYLNTPGGG